MQHTFHWLKYIQLNMFKH